MKNFLNFILFLFIVLSIKNGYGQQIKFNDLTSKDFVNTEDDVFPNASAVIMYRNVSLDFGEKLNVSERIKIYKKDGFEYSNWETNFENVKKLKAFIYNLEDGIVVKTKVEKQSIFKEKNKDGEETTKIVFPNVKEGSIIEVSYIVRDIGLYSINTQFNIPVKQLNIVIRNSTYYDLYFYQNHLSNVKLKRRTKKREFIFNGENIKAFKKENFIPYLNTYVGKIFIEFTTLLNKKEIKTWEQVATYFNSREWFGKELKRPGSFYKKDIEKLVETEKNQLNKAKKIFYYLQDRMVWNKYTSVGSDNIRKAYFDKKGSSADFNLLLINMLREFNIKANPILVVLKINGAILYPSTYKFDSVIAGVEIDNELYLLDASQENAAFGMISENLIYGPGLLINSNNSYKIVGTDKTEKSSQFVIANINFDINNNNLEGTIKIKLDNQFAWYFRDEFEENESEKIIESLKMDNNLLKIEQLKVVNFKDHLIPLNLYYNFEYENYVDEINNDLYFETLLYFGLEENDFKSEEREYPIDFKYPFSKKYIINYKIPEGYEITSLPKNKRFVSENNLASLQYNNSVSGNNFQVLFTLNINKNLVGPEYYYHIKNLFTEYFNISNSKVVLSKIKSN